MECIKTIINEMEKRFKKNIRVLYRSISDFKKTRTNIVKDDKSNWLQTTTVFWLGGGTIFFGY